MRRLRKGRVFATAAVFLALVTTTVMACVKSGAAEVKEDNDVVVDFSSVDNDVVDETESIVEEKVEEVPVSAVPVNAAFSYESGNAVDLSWFDDCVFLGDSLVGGLGMYNDVYFDLGNAQFVYSAGLGYASSQWDIDAEYEIHPYLYGQKILLEDAVSILGAKKVIIGMGMNDLVSYGSDTILEYAKSFIDKIRAKNPDVVIYLETITPMIEEMEYDLLNNWLIQNYDSKLQIFCKENNCGFLNTWAAVANEYGKLSYELCSDPDDLGLHLTLEGYAMVADYIVHNVE